MRQQDGPRISSAAPGRAKRAVPSALRSIQGAPAELVALHSRKQRYAKSFIGLTAFCLS